MMKMLQNHPFHMVTYSPWPILMSFSILFFLNSLTLIMSNKSTNMYLPILSMVLCLIQWARDIIRESTLQGMHTKKIIKGIQLGMIMFIISEILLFSSLFWMLLHSSLSPSHMIGMSWPPSGVNVFNPLGMPMLNTALLLSSGFSITWSHFSLLKNNYQNSIMSLCMTIILGIIFLLIQSFEYFTAPFSISDSIFGSAFFLVTGFHGSHVLLGCILLIMSLYRMFRNHLTSSHHLNFELAAWYWHFVDIIWIFVFMLLYFN
uniref:Cytochrome c oxidase subunit 3 n=1 Tax=Mutilla europaea TaxID=2749339 RepID=A0A7M4C8S0_9HYME|nr:cytochrome c oxidase subunit III [Mutilla europaea]